MNAMKSIMNFIQGEVDWYKDQAKRARVKKILRRRAFILAEKRKMADMKAISTGQKHWVIEDFDGYLHVADRKLIQTFIAHGKLSNKVTSVDFDREALYVAEIQNKTRIPKDGSYKTPMPKESAVRKFARMVLGW